MPFLDIICAFLAQTVHHDALAVLVVLHAEDTAMLLGSVDLTMDGVSLGVLFTSASDVCHHLGKHVSSLIPLRLITGQMNGAVFGSRLITRLRVMEEMILSVHCLPFFEMSERVHRYHLIDSSVGGHVVVSEEICGGDAIRGWIGAETVHEGVQTVR